MNLIFNFPELLKQSMTVVRFLTLLQIFCGLIIFVILFFISAPYGRYFKKDLTFSINAPTAWFIMEFPSLLIMLVMTIYNLNKASDYGTVILAILWITHYFYRSIIYPFIIKRSNPFPFFIILFGFIFNINNSFINSVYLFFSSREIDLIFIIGIILFISGFLIHFTSDLKLKRLRDEKEGYFIPEGLLFKFVSSPNYFGEIIEWIGFAIASRTLAGFAFALFTFANLAPRALANHRWYRKNFANYPLNRKALIPFIF